MIEKKILLLSNQVFINFRKNETRTIYCFERFEPLFSQTTAIEKY
jgi:hypothetical protein